MYIHKFSYSSDKSKNITEHVRRKSSQSHMNHQIDRKNKAAVGSFNIFSTLSTSEINFFC